MADLRNLYVVDNRVVSLGWKLGPGNAALLAIRMGGFDSDEIPDPPPLDLPESKLHQVEIALGSDYQPDLSLERRRERFLRRLSRHAVARLVQFRASTGDSPTEHHVHLVLFREPLVIEPRSRARRGHKNLSDLTISGVFLPPLLSKTPPSFIFESVQVPYGDARFQRNFELSFESARAIKLNEKIRIDSPFTRAYDPMFRSYRSDRNGHNVLTNWVVSIPLAYPTNWTDPRLAQIRSLEGFTQPAWKHVIWFLEGKILEEITPLALDSAASIDTLSGVGLGAGQSDATEPRPPGRYGLCYAGWPHPRVRVVGNYFLVGVKCRDGISWEVDSPEPHTAFRSYREEVHAMMWAQRGDARRQLEHQFRILPAFRVEHRRDTWQQEIPALRTKTFGPILGSGAPLQLV